MDEILERKAEHIEAVLKGDVQARRVTTGLESVSFAHVALPELHLDQIDLSTTFLGRRLAAPLLVSSMTGGPHLSEHINQAIAEAANAVGVAFGVGSQRVALDGTRAMPGLDASLRRLAPDVPILANIGAAQLIQWPDPLERAKRAVGSIEADALIVHLNPLQEAVQRGGDRNWGGVLGQIERLARGLDVPLVVKEVGNGLSGPVARQLVDAGVSILDVAGAGGTSWAAVEAERARDSRARAIAIAFRDWGIPTADSVLAVRAACPEATIIASGGIRTGIDAAKALRLGADLAGQAAALLAGAVEGPQRLVEQLEVVIEQLRIVCFCTASRDLRALGTAQLLEPHRVT
ncbi:MAG: type 2 isopentenyl-diphosphate Delta-isomerase [Rhizobiales bacterium]|nr:type 2 isopentenyl-diphosphate Delta-isomerase [Hyphomicrobiales bacterium]